MIKRLKDLMKFVEFAKVPDDAEIWMEYPDQLAQPEEKHEMVIRGTNSNHIVEDFEAIRSMSWCYDSKTNRLYIQHHY